MTRRAAWRRSERRRPSQRRKKAPARQSAGRRNNPLAASSCRLPGMSLTALHAPARVRGAVRNLRRTSARPAPVGDGGRRRETGVQASLVRLCRQRSGDAQLCTLPAEFAADLALSILTDALLVATARHRTVWRNGASFSRFGGAALGHVSVNRPILRRHRPLQAGDPVINA